MCLFEIFLLRCHLQLFIHILPVSTRSTTLSALTHKNFRFSFPIFRLCWFYWLHPCILFFLILPCFLHAWLFILWKHDWWFRLAVSCCHCMSSLTFCICIASLLHRPTYGLTKSAMLRYTCLHQNSPHLILLSLKNMCVFDS